MATITISGNDLVRDPGLETAVMVSLFTDKRADPSIDTLPDNTQDFRGYWGDSFNEESLGSKLWLLYRSKTTPDINEKVNQRAKESLQWLINDGAVKEISVSSSISNMNTLLLNIDITEPDGQQRFYKYSFNWEAEELKRRD